MLKQKTFVFLTLMIFSTGILPQDAFAKNYNDHPVEDVVEGIGNVASFGLDLLDLPILIASIPAGLVFTAIYGLPEKNAMKRKNITIAITS